MCQKTGRKISKAAPALHCVPVVSPWHHVGIDFIGPISPPSTQGSQYILTVADYFTKFVEAIPTSTKHAEGVAFNLFKVKLIKYVYSYLYHPEHIKLFCMVSTCVHVH